MDEEYRIAFADLKKDIKEYINLRMTPTEEKVNKLYKVVVEGNGKQPLIDDFNDIRQEFEIHKLQERNCPLIIEVNKKVDALDSDIKSTNANLTGYVANNEKEKRAKKEAAEAQQAEQKEQASIKRQTYWERNRSKVAIGGILLTQIFVLLKEIFIK